MDDTVIYAYNLVKIYQVAGLEVVALQGLDLAVQYGELLALVGPSGAGKSTLLAALAGLERPSAGELTVADAKVLTLNEAALARYRREVVGMVWQQTSRNLLTYLSARENIELLAQLNGSSRIERRAWANELLTAVGMTALADRRPTTLSGGQQQRVALACALANRPQILLADEPTGEVDWPTAEQILALLQELRQRYGLTVVLVTHDPRVAAHADRVVAIRDGRTSTEIARSASDDELLVVDQVGRLQLGAEQRERAGIDRRVRVEQIEGGLVIRPVAGDTVETPIAPKSVALAEDAPPLPRRQRWWRRR